GNRMEAGILYVVATPIGNLEDVSLRALRTLKECELIAAEDTRKTRRLLAHYDIHTPLVSFFEHNEIRRTREIIERVRNGERVALVSEAGTPAISDPGFVLVREAVDAGLKVVPIPGPCAAVAALSAAGIPTDSFVFTGFLPRRSGQRRRRLEGLRDIDATLVFYESPHRLIESLRDMCEVLGDRPAAVIRELTKVHEESCRGSLRGLLEQWSGREILGEFTLVVARPGRAGSPAPVEP
ncbi:MAG: 16S rRNA (cytidine(1402)-2'-O)-methyltransferase, partial [Planctomycetota bacterium]|nr:16S rRNA (cytidine(1402)-2'-O)-methyltransferase [Planctomycetota bacterium]